MADSLTQNVIDAGLTPAAWAFRNKVRFAGQLLSKWRTLSAEFGVNTDSFYATHNFTGLATTLDKLVIERDEKNRLIEEARRAELTALERKIEDLEARIKHQILANEAIVATHGTPHLHTLRLMEAELAELKGIQVEFSVAPTPLIDNIINVKITFSNGTFQISKIKESQIQILKNSNEVVSVEIIADDITPITRLTPEGETITATPQNPFVTDPDTGIKVYYNPELVTQEEVKQIIKNSTTEELQNISLVTQTGAKISSTEPLQETQTEASFIEGILDAMARQKGSIIPQAFADTGESPQDDSKINFDFDFKIIAVVIFIVIVLAGAAFVSGGVSSG